MSDNFYVHVVGTGTIGEPLIKLLREAKLQVSFHKASAFEDEKIIALINDGAELASAKDKMDEFAELLGPKYAPTLTRNEALTRANVVIDCTPYGNKLKDETYYLLNDGKRKFAAQGSEDGFGIKFASGVNNSFVEKALWEENQPYVQVVSCNTHNLLALITAIGTEEGKYSFDEIVYVDFSLMRRVADVSQVKAIPAPEIGYFDDDVFGTHQAADAAHLIRESFGVDLAGKIFSSAHKMPTPFMHMTEFRILVKRKMDYDYAKSLFENSWRYAITRKLHSNQVFAFGRDHGFYGRILNQSVICIDEKLDEKKGVLKRTLRVADHPEGTLIVGSTLTPQDGNSLLTSLEFAMMCKYKEAYSEAMKDVVKRLPVRFDKV